MLKMMLRADKCRVYWWFLFIIYLRLLFMLYSVFLNNFNTLLIYLKRLFYIQLHFHTLRVRFNLKIQPHYHVAEITVRNIYKIAISAIYYSRNIKLVFNNLHENKRCIKILKIYSNSPINHNKPRSLKQILNRDIYSDDQSKFKTGIPSKIIWHSNKHLNISQYWLLRQRANRNIESMNL